VGEYTYTIDIYVFIFICIYIYIDIYIYICIYIFIGGDSKLSVAAFKSWSDVKDLVENDLITEALLNDMVCIYVHIYMHVYYI
jgi:hypothetical protein